MITKPATTGPEIFDTRAARFFRKVITYPKTVLVLSLIVFALCAAFLPQTTRDTRAEAFISPKHPALIYRDKVEEIFGLADPVIVAVVNEKDPNGVFNPQTLDLVDWLTYEIMDLEGVDPERVRSIATENDIYGTEFGMEIEEFFAYPPETQEEAGAVREKVMDFPLYLGSLVAEDGSATLIVAELLDQTNEARNYNEFLKLVDRAPALNGEELHVAGEGAVSEYLGAYIDRDAKRLNPISALVITLVLLVAYRTLRGIILPNLVVLGALAVCLGSMAGFGVPFYVITNSLPVIIIAISVADAIHILSTYYEELAFHPEESQDQLVIRSMVHMWRPVTFTSFTDMAGFAGLGIASFMPPMRFFGLFACVGVAGALLFSMFTVPAGLVLLKKKQSAPFKKIRPSRGAQSDAFSALMARLGRWVIARPRGVAMAAAVLTVAGVFGAVQLEVNEERMSVFRDSEPIVKADNAINATLDGTNYLDIVIETPEKEDLFKPDNLRRIEALQAHVETLPNVGGTTSIVDYLKQMHRAVNEDRKEMYKLPDNEELIAQYFLLYSASGDPTDFEEEIDYDYRLANVRARMTTGKFTSLEPVVLETERYIEEEFNAPGISAHLAGRVNVDYHWIKDLARSHFTGVGLALFGIWLMASASFRSLIAGLFAAVPVCLALLSIYAVMGAFGIWLGVGTTMFAAIGIGVSVDFSIHTLDRLMALIKEQGRDIDQAFELLYPSTGRALFFSFLAMGLGFGVLLTSEVPPLNRFGALVAVAVTISFITSMTVLPALLKLVQPAFLGLRRPEEQPAGETQLDPAK